MVTIVFLIGALNFGLGFGLAIFLERPLIAPNAHFSRRIRWRRFAQPKPPESILPEQVSVTDATDEESEAVAPPRVARMDFPWLPPVWADLLYAQQVTVQSFPEALFWVTQHEMTGCCDRLQQCDQNSRCATDEFNVEELKAVCGECRSKLNALKTAIGECKEPGSHGDLLVHFIQWMQESDQRIEQIVEACEQAKSNPDTRMDCPSGRRHLLEVFSQLHTLSERCQDSLARLLSTEKRISKLSEALTIEPRSSALNRLGMELVIQQWMEKDPDRVRMASAVLVDVDHCAQLIEQRGMLVTSQILASTLSLLVEVVRKDRGFDRVMQLAGPTFLVFLGDTAMRNAIVGAERIRQNISAAVFKAKDTNISVTASCTVTEWNPSESFDEMMIRLRSGILEAKKSGRNCTVACGPDDMRVIESSRMQVTAREFAVQS